MRQFAWLLVVLVNLPIFAADEVRTWTDTQGRKMQAQFVREVDGDVTFIRDGKLITFPLDQLSEDDQKFIREAEAGKKVEENVLPAGAPRKVEGAEGFSLPADSATAEDTKANLAKQRINSGERTWRDLRGKQTVGKFVRIHQGNVVLLRGGRAVTIPFYLLSRQDREYVQELLAARGETAQIPPEPQEEAIAGAPPAVEGGQGGAPPGMPMPAGGPPAGVGGPVAGAGGPIGGRGPGSAPNDQLAKLQEQNKKTMDEMRERQQQITQENAARTQQGIQRMQTSLPTTQQESPSDLVGSCSNCKKQITREQSQGQKCPNCGVVWLYEVDEFGRKKEIPGAAAALAASDDSQWGSGWKFERRHWVKLFTRIIIPLVVMLFAAIGAAMRNRK